ncbi:unnamed protein product [Camellia sinensis]
MIILLTSLISPSRSIAPSTIPLSMKDAMTTLYKLCTVKVNKERAVKGGAVKAVVGLVAVEQMAEKAMVVMSSLAAVAEGKEAIVEEGGIAALVEAVEDGSRKGRRGLLVREGEIPPLAALAQTGTAKAKHKAETLLRYLREQRQEASTLMSWDHHDILSVLPEFNSSGHCSTSARLWSIASYSGRKETAVYATDVHTGMVIRCKVYIDNFSRIQIFHNSIKLDLDGLATLHVRAFDDEETAFSSLVGLQFMCHLMPEANGLPHHLVHIPLQDSPLSDCGGLCGLFMIASHCWLAEFMPRIINGYFEVRKQLHLEYKEGTKEAQVSDCNLQLPNMAEDDFSVMKNWVSRNYYPASHALDNGVESGSVTMEGKKRGSEKLDQKQVVHRKSIDTFGQRTSQYRGVTRCIDGLVDMKPISGTTVVRKRDKAGKEGGYDMEAKAARAYDLAALKYWGPSTHINFPLENYQQELEHMKNMTRQEYVAHLRRKSSGFSRGASMYRGVTRHHQHGRWQARIGRVAGNKDLYLGTFMKLFAGEEEVSDLSDNFVVKTCQKFTL